MNVTEKSLIENAQQAIGDGEQVLAAGVFQPRKSSGALGAGVVAGTVAGSIPGVGGLAEGAAALAGTTGGYFARHGLADEEGIPVNTLIAVTSEHLYAFKAKHDDVVGYKVGKPFATWERDRIAVTVHGRVNVRLFAVEDLDSGETYEFETPRFSTMHGSLVVKLLEQDDAETESETAPA